MDSIRHGGRSFLAIAFVSMTMSAHAFEWIPYGRGSGACNGPNADANGMAVDISDNNDIVLRSDYSPANGCLWMTSSTSIDLNEVPRIEVDVQSSGNGSPWFSLWLDPVVYMQPPQNSAEIDLVENLGFVATNFAGCNDEYRCGQRSWGVAGNAVRHHITLNYDKFTRRVEVYHCAFGSQTCSPTPNAPFMQLDMFLIANIPQYLVVVDIWYTQPGQHFEFAVSNLRFFAEPAPPAPSPSPPSPPSPSPPSPPSPSPPSPPSPSPPAPSPDCSGPNLCCPTCEYHHYCPGNGGCYKEGQPGCPGGYCPDFRNATEKLSARNRNVEVKGMDDAQMIV